MTIRLMVERWLIGLIREGIGESQEITNLSLAVARLEQQAQEREAPIVSWVPDPAAERVLEKHLKAISRDAAQRPLNVTLPGPERVRRVLR